MLVIGVGTGLIRLKGSAAAGFQPGGRAYVDEKAAFSDIADWLGSFDRTDHPGQLGHASCESQ